MYILLVRDTDNFMINIVKGVKDDETYLNISKLCSKKCNNEGLNHL